MLHKEKIPGPTVEIDANRARNNIKRMLAKARDSNAILRPHFKTHQSLTVAEWFRDEGIDCCTVSSPAMAEYFAEGGWRDILIAFPAQPGAMSVYHKLASQIRLGLLGDSTTLIDELESGLKTEVDFWIEVDAGYGRSGVNWINEELLTEIARKAEACEQINLRGLLSHAGDSYACHGVAEISAVYEQSSTRLKSAQACVEISLGRKVELSFGDTPTCSVCDDFSAFDELRPGNFVFYDLMQYQIGSCRMRDIALGLACPVVGIYPDRSEVVIHGGAVHFSKEKSREGHFGQVYVRSEEGTQSIVEGAVVSGLSQEHGVISGSGSWVRSLTIGDIVRVLPVHSCLTMDCMLNRQEPLIFHS